MQAMFPAAAVPTAPSRHAPGGRRGSARVREALESLRGVPQVFGPITGTEDSQSEEAEAREVAVTLASACASRAERSSGAGAAPACAAGQTRNPIRGLALLQVRCLFSAGFSATKAVDAAPARDNAAV